MTKNLITRAVCAITASGVATVRFSAVLAVAAGSMTYNVFWTG
jgi:hypothetical protein